MKGFGIYVKNDLLDPKHYRQMGDAIWLFLWLLDKMTIIDGEKGEGLVLGGKPIKFDEIGTEIGVSRSTYLRWIETLSEANYIKTKRTPYGLIITVHKAEKIFGNNGQKKRSAKNDTSEMFQNEGRDVSESQGKMLVPDTSNKTIQETIQDNTEGDTPSKFARKFFSGEKDAQRSISDWIKKQTRTEEVSTGIREEVRKFIVYWTEPNKSGTKVKWEMQETFEVKRRLHTWLSRASKYSAASENKYTAARV